MTWFDYFLIAWLAFGAFSVIALVGKPRKPIEPLTASISTGITTLLIVGILFARGVFA